MLTVNRSTAPASPPRSAPEWVGFGRLFKPFAAAWLSLVVALPDSARRLASRAVSKANRAMTIWLATCNPATLIWLWLGLGFMAGEVDWVSGPEWAFAIFFLLPV